MGQDLIQDLWQDQRINDVSPQLDRFAEHRASLIDEIRCASGRVFPEGNIVIGKW